VELAVNFQFQGGKKWCKVAYDSRFFHPHHLKQAGLSKRPVIGYS
jgi:hypothetical protein